MIKIISAGVLVICVVIIVIAIYAMFKLLAVILGLTLIVYLCWLTLKPLFLPKTK